MDLWVWGNWLRYLWTWLVGRWADENYGGMDWDFFETIRYGVALGFVLIGLGDMLLGWIGFGLYLC
jgi:hypothetical protein